MPPPTLQTNRLILRRWRADDAAPYAALCADAEVMRHIGAGETRTRAQAEASIQAFEREWDQAGYGLFAVERRDDGQFIGFTGLSVPTFLPEVMPTVEIGWRLARDAWGRGYASEAAQAALDFGLQTRSLDEIVGIYQSENRASGRIMEKIGMRFDRETVDPTCGRSIIVYRTRPE